MIFRAAICDDEQASLDYLSIGIRKSLEKKGHWVNISCFLGAAALLNTPNYASRFDLYFLDIDMPAVNGIVLADKINREATGCIAIVYISNREDMVFSALKTRPLRFIRKRFFHEEIDETVDAILAQMQNQRDDVLTFETDEGMRALRRQDILYIESFNKRQKIYALQGEYSINATLDFLEAQMQGKGFLKIHRSYLVNLQHISLIEKESVLLDQGGRVPMSRRRREEIKQQFQRWLMG